jgi:hypothetical protein
MVQRIGVNTLGTDACYCSDAVVQSHKEHTEHEDIANARVDSVQFGSGSTVVVPKSGVEAGVWNDALRPRVAVPRLLRGKRARRMKQVPDRLD